MRFDAFMGGSFESQSYKADLEDTWNWYPEQLESQGATQRHVLYPTPGVAEIADASAGAGRAHFFQGGREFAVIGTAFLEIDSGGNITSRGTVELGDDPATISSNGDGGGQLFVTSGDNGYVYDLTTNVLSAIAALDGKATMGAHLDGYFLALDAATSTFYFSDLLDGSTWDTAENFGQRSLAPDPWLSMKVLGRIIWFFGEYTSETWFDTGAAFPFAPTPSGLMPYGISAPFSPAIIGDDIIWIGATQAGRRPVLRAQGIQPDIISTKPLESAFETYDGLANATGDVYSERGHTFYLISFDGNDVTWAFDTETRLWCKRGTWISGESRFASWRPRFVVPAFGELRTLDVAGGKVYRMSAELTIDVDGLFIRRVRRAPAINNELRRVFYPAFELDLEAEANSATLASFTMEDSDPQISATWVQSAESSRVTYTLDFGVLVILTVDVDYGEGAGWELDVGTGPTYQNNYGGAGEDATYAVKFRANTATDSFELDFNMTTNWAAGQSGSAP